MASFLNGIHNKLESDLRKCSRSCIDTSTVHNGNHCFSLPSYSIQFCSFKVVVEGDVIRNDLKSIDYAFVYFERPNVWNLLIPLSRLQYFCSKMDFLTIKLKAGFHLWRLHEKIYNFRVDEKGCVNVEDIIAEILPQTCLITVMYANNETGVIMPISEVGLRISQINSEREKVKLPKILFHTDAAQIIGKERINFYGSNVDFMTIVGHKFYGPRIGCICAKKKVFPLFFGGGQENSVRPGTENTPMIVGLGIASGLVSSDVEKYKAHMLECREKLERKLQEVFGNEIVINCSESKRLPNTCNFSFRENGLKGSVVLSFCEKVVASVGAACHGGQCSQILINSGVPEHLAKNAIRLSVGRNTTIQDIEDAVLDLECAVRKVKSCNFQS